MKFLAAILAPVSLAWCAGRASAIVAVVRFPRRMTARPLRAALCGAAWVALLFDSVAAEGIPRGAKWKFWAEKSPPPAQWMRPDFDDSRWRSGAAGFGYGDNDDATLIDNMEGQFDRIYIRRMLSTGPETRSLTLHIRYDDAFIAYLDGEEVARAGVDDDGLVTEHEASGFERFGLAVEVNAGQHCLAIAGFNRSLGSSDFTLAPYIEASTDAPIPEGFIGADQAIEDLRELEKRLLNQAAYLRKRPVTPLRSLNEAIATMPPQIQHPDFARLIAKLLAPLGDCHADVSSPPGDRDPGDYLPFRLAPHEKGIVAVTRSRTGFVADDMPYLKSIDGVPIQSWIDTASLYVADGSPQFKMRRALFFLQRLDVMRPLLGLKTRNTVTAEFSDGAELTRKLTFKTRSRFSSQAKLAIPGESQLLEGNIGYLRIAAMDGEQAAEIRRWMRQFEMTEGLIIDVRDNGGGDYHILHALYPYFVASGTFYVSNVAAYRLAPYFRSDHIFYRPTFPADHEHWNTGERQAIAEVSESFAPDWKLAPTQFSPWHYAVLGRRDDAHFHYLKPITVLSDEWCFSATDGFLGAFSDLPQAYLIGRPSSGGSGATRRFRLPNSRLEIALSSMASFRPDGRSYDGLGIDVDLEIWPRLKNLLGNGDAALETARQYLLNEARQQ